MLRRSLPLTVSILNLMLVTLLVAAPATEGNKLVSFAQDLYRQKGINIPRSAFEFQETEEHGRIFLIKLVTRNSTLPGDLLQAFQIGGAVSQHANQRMDQILVVAELDFSHSKPMRLWASGACCEKLYNNRLIPDAFTQGCLRIEE